MPEISLKEYFSKLNDFLSERAVDEVLLHCRQILQFYPKNVTAYRYLGRALVMSGRWEEGRESLRRVLSVIPDDYQAHLALSEANERLGRSDEAIWHLERAFEQRPNDKDIIDALRALYSLHRNINNLKIQLTSAAVARQYARSGAYNQAVDTLRSALSRMNERLDLKLLLAQILQEHGEQEEAAELALEVLGVLPDCLEANHIMAELWLSVNRPSDAQRYVNRLEAVDPYLAVEVAQGYPPDEDTFRLDELDYVRTAQSELASSRLDWLQEIASMPTPAGEAMQEASSDDLTDWASAMLSGRTSDEPEDAEAEDEPTSSRFAAMAEDAEAEEEPINFTAMFGQPEPADADELEAMFAPDPAVDRDNPMAWLHAAGVEIVDAGNDDARYEDLFDDAMPTLEEEDPMGWLRDSAGQDDESVVEMSTDDAVDPMSWLRDSGFDPEAEQAPAFSEMSADDESDNPFAWDAGDAGLESDASQPERVAAMPDDEDDDPFAWRANDAGVALDDVLSDSPESDGELEPLDWLQDEQLLDEALSLDGLNTDDPAAVWEGFDASDTVDADMDEGAVAEDVPSEPAVPGGRRGLTAMLQEANLDWISKPAGEPTADDDMDDWLNQFGAAPEPQQSVTDNPDWLTELDQPETNKQAFAGEAFDEEAFTLDTGESDSQFAVEAAEEETAMSDQHLHDPEEPEDEDVDWMRDLVSEPDAESDDFDDADDESAELDDADALEEAEMPDWMAELEPESETEPEADESAEAEPVAEEDMSWLAEAALTELDDEETPEEAEMPDWLADLDPDAPPVGDSETEPELAPPDMNDFPWMADESEEEPEPEEDEAVAAEMPNWLTEMAPEEEALEAEIEADAGPLAEEDLSWLGDEASEDEEVAAVADSDMPDWLSEMEPEPELEVEPDLEPEPESELEPVAEVELEAEPEEELEPPDAGDFPWMGDEEEAVEQPAEYEDFPWMGDEDEADEDSAEAEAVAGDVPDWLASVGADDEEEEQESVIPFNEEPLPEPEDAVAEAIPGWLSEAEPDEEEADTEPQLAEDDLSWLDDEEAGEAAAAAEVEPEEDEIEEEQVAEMDDDYGASDDFEPEQEEEYGFLSEAGDAFLEASPAHNAPDWLNAMVPGLDVDYEPGEEAFVEDEEEPVDDESAQREFAWLDNLVEEEMAATTRPEFAFSRLPRWLGSSGASMDDDSADDAFPDWPSDDADADVPEWLR